MFFILPAEIFDSGLVRLIQLLKWSSKSVKLKGDEWKDIETNLLPSEFSFDLLVSVVGLLQLLKIRFVQLLKRYEVRRFMMSLLNILFVVATEPPTA